MLHPPQGVAAMLHAYMDASGSHSASPVISISGFIGEESAWIEFDQAWNAVLDDNRWPSRLSEFHMVDCAHGDNDFFVGRWNFAERLRLYGQLTEVISKCEIRPLSASVLTGSFRQIPEPDLRLLQLEENRLGTPLDLVFRMIIQQVLFHVYELHPKETVAVLFDEDSKLVEEKFADFCQHYRDEFYLGDLFEGYGFASSKKFTPLQAADLLAYGTHHLSQSKFLGDSYRAPDFPVHAAFWNMLLALAQSSSTSPYGTLIDHDGLKALVEKVRRGERLPKKGTAVGQ